MSESDRQQRMVERILEDERLRGDLDDAAAAALVKWASEQAAAAAADPARPDDAVEAQVQAVRAAAREAARSGETDPQRLIAQAAAALAPRQAALAAPSPAAVSPGSAGVAPTSPAPATLGAESAAPPAAPQPASTSGQATAAQRRSKASRRWGRLGRWLKRMRKGR